MRGLCRLNFKVFRNRKINESNRFKKEIEERSYELN